MFIRRSRTDTPTRCAAVFAAALAYFSAGAFESVHASEDGEHLLFVGLNVEHLYVTDAHNRWGLGASVAYSRYWFGATVGVQLAESEHGSIVTGVLSPSLDLWLLPLYIPACVRLGPLGGVGVDWDGHRTLLAGASFSLLVADENHWYELFYRPARRVEEEQTVHEVGFALGWTNASF